MKNPKFTKKNAKKMGRRGGLKTLQNKGKMYFRALAMYAARCRWEKNNHPVDKNT